jgi:hypothetical protein
MTNPARAQGATPAKVPLPVSPALAPLFDQLLQRRAIQQLDRPVAQRNDAAALKMLEMKVQCLTGYANRGCQLLLSNTVRINF